MKHSNYVHGYSPREMERLLDQAQALTDLLHHDTHYPDGSRVLEAGCGVGAQTVPLALRSPGAGFTSVDLSAVSLEQARKRVLSEGLENVTFKQADIFHLPYETERYDHIFVCFVLEHLSDPARALAGLKKVLNPGGTITVIEGDHGSTLFYPRSRDAQRTIDCLVAIQEEMGGNALIGREIFPLLTGAGFSGVKVSPRMVCVDSSRPDLIEGFTKQTFISMVEGVREEAVTREMMSVSEWDKGILDLYRTCWPDGVFCYTFFKGVGTKVKKQEF